MKKLLILPFLFICIVSSATNYYVRAGGSDSGTGLSDVAAWATVAKVNSSMSLFKPGDAILFRRGDTWSNVTINIGTSGVQGNNIILGAYGTGSRPVISAATNSPAIIVTSANRGYWTIDNLDLRASGVQNGSYGTSAIQHAYWLTDMGPVPGWIIQNCSFNCCVMLSGPNTIVRNNTFNGSLSTNNRGGAITFRGPECKSVIVEYNDISGYYDRGIWIYNGGTSPVFRYNKISNIKKGADHGGSGINVDGYGKRVNYGEIYGNNISNIDMYAITFENGYYASVYNNRTDNSGGVMIWQYPVNGDGSNYAGTGNMDIHHNVFHNGNVGIVLYNAASMKIANNDFVKDNPASTNEGALLVSGSSTYVSGISFVNNIISGSWPHAIKLPDTKNIWSSFDYNDIIPVGSEIVNAGSSSQSLAQLQSSGYMTHGISADPKFVSATSDWHLQQISPAINKGTNLGYTSDFDGRTLDAQPDMGAFEYAGIVQAPVSPVYSGSSIQNTTPSVLEMTYNMTLANIVPVTSAFNVIVNSVVRTVSGVAISGSKVLLTLASPVKSGETVTVAYTKPATNPLQSTLGGIAETIIAQPVTNNITSSVAAAPLFVSAAIQNATPALLEMTYNMTLANILPATTSFEIRVNSITRNVSSVAISGSKVLLTLASPVAYRDTITVSYTKPALNPLQTAEGGQATTMGAQKVTNYVAAAIPRFVSAAVQNASPAILEMTYNTTLSGTIPSPTAFTVIVNSNPRTVSSVAISGTIVKLTLASQVNASEAVTVAYTKPLTNPLQTTNGGQAETIGAQSVVNNVTLAGQVDIPQFKGASIANETPEILEMTYDMTLANIIPAASAFSVTVNSVSRNVTSVRISGSKVLLTLVTQAFYGDQITVAYTKPASNQLQSTSGKQAASISGQLVINNVSKLTQGNISIFPSPARTFINVQVKEAITNAQFIRIYDMDGVLQMEAPLSTTSDKTRIDIKLKSGIYVARVVSGQIILYSQKLIVV
jgi:uncharacterized repeat protein (TIGR02059 family)